MPTVTPGPASATPDAAADPGPRPADAVLPDGFAVQIDTRCRPGRRSRHLVGGSPVRMLRLSDVALRLIGPDGRIVVRDGPTRALARTLLDAGVAHPRPAAGPAADEVTVVIPVRDNQAGVDRLLDAVVGLPVIVVDDGSTVPIRVGPEVRLLRSDRNRGPAAARNLGAASSRTAFVAFLDSDVVPEPGWLDHLLPHFADPTVAVVAPRIVGLRVGRGIAERYENGWSSLDMGAHECQVVPGTPVPYVPSAAMVVRRSAFLGFDESLRVAEDVDLCWRTHDEGGRVRYEPTARVAHDHRTDLRAVLSRRRFYGTGAAPLAAAYGNRGAPTVMSFAMAVTVAALLTRSRVGAAIAAVLLVRMSHRLRGRLGDLPSASLVASRMTLRAAGFGLLQVAASMCRHHWPVAVCAAVVSRRFRTLFLQVAVAEGVVEWVRHGLADPVGAPTLGPVRYVVMRRLDDLAYGAGLWQGAIARRDLTALRPVITR